MSARGVKAVEIAAVVGAAVFFFVMLCAGCAAQQVREKKAVTITKTAGDTVTATVHEVETTAIELSPKLPDLPGVEGSGIETWLAGLIPGGGALLVIWQLLKRLGVMKKIATIQTAAIAEKDVTGVVKAEVASKAVHRGVEAKVHKFVKSVTG